MGKFEKETPSQETPKAYADWELADIIKWCQENNQVEWLKKTAAEKVERKVYPKKRIARVDEDGNPILTKKGKQSYTTISDKTAEPTITTDKISFVELKDRFLHNPDFGFKFPEKKTKEPNMYDLINGL